MITNLNKNCTLGSIFFVEAALTGSGLLHVQWAIDHGLDVWLITTDPGKFKHVLCGEVMAVLQDRKRIIVSETTEGTVISDLVKTQMEHAKKQRAVVCVSDRNLVFAAALAANIGAKFASVEAIECLRDKRRARALFDEIELPTARWRPAVSVADVVSFVGEICAPIVIKNCRGTGSLDVKLGLNLEQSVQHYQNMSLSPRYLNGDLMLEEYLYGPLVSLEVLVRDEQCIELGITDRQLGPLPNFCEISYTFPVSLPDSIAKSMLETTQKLVSHLHIEQGLLHVEFIVTSNGPKLVEVNPRLGGGLLAQMMNDCLSISVSELLILASFGALGNIPKLNGKSSSTTTVYPNRYGRLQSLNGLERAAASPFIRQIVPLAKVGDEIMPAQDYRGAVCQIRATADSAALAFNGAQVAAQLVAPELEQIN
jgi:biotin carboxylase